MHCFPPMLYLYSIVTELHNKFPKMMNDVDEEGNTALHLACTYGFQEVVKVLIEKGATTRAM